jgi:hypothetical protein
MQTGSRNFLLKEGEPRLTELCLHLFEWAQASAQKPENKKG